VPADGPDDPRQIPVADPRPPTPAKSPRSARRPVSGNHAALIAHHSAEWSRRFSGKYAFQNAKDSSGAGRILAACGDDLVKAKRIVSDFIFDSDPFIAKSGYTIAFLASQINRYLAGAHRPEGSNGNGHDPEFSRRNPTAEELELIRQPIGGDA
jgi:hypothetical protein